MSGVFDEMLAKLRDADFVRDAIKSEMSPSEHAEYQSQGVGMKEPNVDCDYCGGDGTISHTGYDDFDLYVHFGSMTCECVKEYAEEETK